VSRWVLATLIIAMLLIPLAAVEPARAQPTWSFKVQLLPSDFYMGEWGTLQANITNYDCVQRVDWQEHFDEILEEELEAMEQRAEEMKNMSLIKDYYVEVERSWGRGGMIYHEANLYLYGACSGRSIKILWVRFWFDWSRYGGREAAGFEAQVNRVLKAYDPVQYVLNGASPESSVIVSTRIFIPEWIEPDERLKRPYLDIRVDYPGWIEYTLEKFPVEGPFEIQPYRSFNLTITDFDGVRPLPGAKVVIRQLIRYYRRREYITPDNGTISVYRLPEEKYEVRVYWNSSYRQELGLVYLGMPTAYDLASTGVLRTRIFTLRISPLDRKGRPLIGARVILDGFERIAENGTAVYELVPQGNHSIQVYWMGLKLHDGWLWAGYHPTYHPSKPATEHLLRLPVDDLVVQAVDTGGNPVGASFNVTGLGGRLRLKNLYSRNGSLVVSQLPVADYKVEAVNCSKVFDRCVRSNSTLKPGEPSKIVLPIHSVRLRILDAEGRPLPGLNVSLAGIKTRTDDDGYAVYTGVPEGSYRIQGSWLGVKVFDQNISVSSRVEMALKADVYDVKLKIVRVDGKPFRASYELAGPAGRFRSEFADVVEVHRIPEGVYALRISLGNRTLLELSAKASELSKLDSVKVPVGDLRVTVKVGGRPLEDAKIQLIDLEAYKVHEAVAKNGRYSFKDLIYGKYLLRVFYPWTRIPVYNRTLDFEGEAVEVELEEAGIGVRVLDFFGRPVQGAEVTVSYFNAPLAKEFTDSSGMAMFKLVKLPSYEVEVRYRGESERRVCPPASMEEFRLGSAEVLGLRVKVSELASYGYIIALIAISMILVIAVFKAVRRVKR